jgi:predicted phage gp36 major capsid-like protein
VALAAVAAGVDGDLNTINALRNVPAFTGATTSIVNDTNPNGPTLLGKSLLESTSIVGTFATTNKVLAFLDASQYYIVDRVGMSILYDPVVLGANRRPHRSGAPGTRSGGPAPTCRWPPRCASCPC